MKVFHFGSSLSGGANIAGLRLHKALVRKGVESTFLHGASSNNDQTLSCFNNSEKFLDSVLSRLKYGTVSRQWTDNGFVASNSYFKRTRSPITDYTNSVVCLHWVSAWLDLKSFFLSIPSEVPIFWVLHDLIPVTGGCSNPYSCTRYCERCGSCPQLKKPSPYDLSRQNFLEKLYLYRNRSIHLIANSSWTLNKAIDSALGKYARSVDMIHYGLSLQEYQPIDKDVARFCLRLPTTSKFLIGFSCLDLNDERKGARILLAAISMMNPDIRAKCMLVGMGGGILPNIDDLMEIKFFGSVSDPRLQSIYYSSLDIFVLPSLSESFGNVVIEAMACKTPVVAFDCGGPRDIITSDQDGILIDKTDPQSLCAAISAMVNMQADKRRQFGERARQKVATSFVDEYMADNYIVKFASSLRGAA